MHTLSNAEIAAVAKDLAKGFREEFQLEQLIATAADLDLAGEIGRGLPLNKAMYEAVRLTEATGKTEMLLREAAFQRPENRVIQDLVARYGLAPAPMSNVRVFAAGAAQAIATAAPGLAEPADIRAYEANVLRLAGSVKPGDWRQQMAERESTVCQILYRGDAIGTGFLVGTDRVMSNWHVFEDLQQVGQLGALGDYTVRFDYRAASGQVPASNGKMVPIDASKGYLAASEKTAFDYVLLQLVSPSGNDVVDTAGRKRGWLRPSTRLLQQLEPVLVLQHPKGRTLELAIGPVTGWVAERENEIYQHWANTDEGSSGSPCFSVGWQLVALHHRADPQGGPRPNRAIAMSALLADMGAHGKLALLPPLD